MDYAVTVNHVAKYIGLPITELPIYQFLYETVTELDDMSNFPVECVFSDRENCSQREAYWTRFGIPSAWDLRHWTKNTVFTMLESSSLKTQWGYYQITFSHDVCLEDMKECMRVAYFEIAQRNKVNRIRMFYFDKKIGRVHKHVVSYS